jgi:hypothetical protein
VKGPQTGSESTKARRALGGTDVARPSTELPARCMSRDVAVRLEFGVAAGSGQGGRGLVVVD